MEETYDNMLKRLRMYRLKHGMIQAEFGRLLGMSQAEYSYKESGKLIISYQNLLDFGKAGINVDFLVTGVDYKYTFPEIELLFSKCKDYETRELLMKIFAEILLYKYKKQIKQENSNTYSADTNVKNKLEKQPDKGELLEYMLDSWDGFSMIQYIRNHFGYSQIYMSEKLGMSIKKYRQMERQNIYPDAAMLVDLYNISGYEPDMFFDKKDRRLIIIEKIWNELRKEERGILLGVINDTRQYI